MQAKKIKYSILELATVRTGDNAAGTFSKSLDLAQHAEGWGYTRFWLAEHHNMKSVASAATPVLIGHIAGGTQTIRVGSGGIMLPNHAPLIVAEQFGTLGSLYPGRIDLGLGRAPGTDQVTAHAIRRDRMRSVMGFPEEIVQIQSFFSEDNYTSPVRAAMAEGVKVPMYILGSSTDSAHVAAALGLPYAFASHFAPSLLFEALEIYHREFKPSAYLQQPYTLAGINVIAADTRDEAEYLATSSIRLMLGVMTSQIDYLQPAEPMTPELRALSANPAFERMLKYAFFGSREDVTEKTIDFIQKTGVDEVIVSSNVYEHAKRLRSYQIFSEIMNELEVYAHG